MTTTVAGVDSPTVAALSVSFRRTLRSENKSPRTITAYLSAVEQFARFLEGAGMPLALASIRREHVEAFIEDQLDRYKTTTAHNRYRGLDVFFKWAVDDGEISASPMARMKPPQLVLEPQKVLTEAEIGALLKACKGRTFTAYRDYAIVSLFLDTGLRLSELTNIQIDDLDLDASELTVQGKGRKYRTVALGDRVTRAPDKYLRMRSKRPNSRRSELWLGHAGPMTPNGVGQLIRRIGERAGVEGLHPHTFRQTFAHMWLAQGANETDLMELMGWSSRSMIERYAACTRSARARQAHRRFSPLDNI